MTITHEQMYNGFKINQGATNGKGCRKDILDRYREELFGMLQDHSKVMQIRFDLRYPADGSVPHDPQKVYRFTENIKRKMKRSQYAGGHCADPRLIKVQEQDTSSNPHFHCTLLVNGNALQSYLSVLKNVVDPLWKQALQTDRNGLVDYCDNNGENGIMIRRGSSDMQQQIEKCIYQASYMAKVNTKENNPKGTWSSSRNHRKK